MKKKNTLNDPVPSSLKTSFGPIVCDHTRILILGSSPGDRSLSLQQYYGHPQNRFWRVMAFVTKSDVPSTYDEKKALILNNGFGLWDVAQHVIREGSMDHAITFDEPNDISGLLAARPAIRVVGFNGKKAEALFNKYFIRNDRISYLSLPSTSPANAGIGFEALCKNWSRLSKDIF
ncbi:G/U mismatch-specific uracil-DNA glycosylase [bacterium A37T11]|nr:G/U mismatch-specific uracil-DNA glycosylase [bacterium A37T11]